MPCGHMGTTINLTPHPRFTMCAPIRCRNRLAIPIGQIELNIAGHVPGLPFGGPFSIAAKAGGSRQSNPVAVWADGWSVSGSCDHAAPVLTRAARAAGTNPAYRPINPLVAANQR